MRGWEKGSKTLGRLAVQRNCRQLRCTCNGVSDRLCDSTFAELYFVTSKGDLVFFSFFFTTSQVKKERKIIVAEIGKRKERGIENRYRDSDSTTGGDKKKKRANARIPRPLAGLGAIALATTSETGESRTAISLSILPATEPRPPPHRWAKVG